MMDTEQLDVVHICLPHYLHAPATAADVFIAADILQAVDAFEAAICDGISYCQYSGENTLALAYLYFFLL